MRIRSSASRRPTTARSTSATIRSPSVPTSSSASSRLEPLTRLDRLAQRVERQARSEPLQHPGRALAHQLVRRGAEQGARLVGVALEVDAAALLEALTGDLAQDEPQALAVRGARDGEVELALEPL